MKSWNQCWWKPWPSFDTACTSLCQEAARVRSSSERKHRYFIHKFIHIGRLLFEEAGWRHKIQTFVSRRRPTTISRELGSRRGHVPRFLNVGRSLEGGAAPCTRSHYHASINWTKSGLFYWRRRVGVPGTEGVPYVTKSWIGNTKRGPSDIDITNTPGGKESVVRHDEYSFVDVSSCSHDNKNELKGLRDSFFELQHDGSERAYSSGLISEGTRSPIIYLWLTSWENKSHSNNTLWRFQCRQNLHFLFRSI